MSEPLPGRSQTVPGPRTGAEVVAELHDLLANAGVPGPYVLVGHSLGGLFNLLYARTHPDQVVGLVMVDATPPALPELMTAREWDLVLGKQTLEPQSPIKGYAMESYDVRAMIKEIDAAPALPRMPTVLLVADKTPPGAPKEWTDDPGSRHRPGARPLRRQHPRFASHPGAEHHPLHPAAAPRRRDRNHHLGDRRRSLTSRFDSVRPAPRITELTGVPDDTSSERSSVA